MGRLLNCGVRLPAGRQGLQNAESYEIDRGIGGLLNCGVRIAECGILKDL